MAGFNGLKGFFPAKMIVGFSCTVWWKDEPNGRGEMAKEIFTFIKIIKNWKKCYELDCMATTTDFSQPSSLSK